ncbi:MAG: hypothetical protein JW699_03775 [Chitinispirillaceae bacterium]|nr:hypothetical protein [Chitinispirillaceae bacterium]
MITINLLKKASARHGGTGVGAGRILAAGVMGLAVVAAGAGIMWWWHERPRIGIKFPAAWFEKIVPEKKSAAVSLSEPEKKTVVSAPQPAPAAVSMPEPKEKPGAPVTAAPQPVPGTTQASAITSVPPLPPAKKAVPEAAAVAAAEPRAPEPAPRKVDPAQKFGNDIAFVNHVLKRLAEAVPEGIGFGTLTIDSGAVVTGVGTAETRDLVSSLFLNLRREQMNVLGHPDSYIGDNDGKGYSFVFVCRPSFGDAPADMLRSRNNLVPQSSLPRVIKTFSRTAARNHLFLKSGLSRTAVKKTGGYVHNIYRFSCTGTYRNFTTFVLELERARMLCAFSAVRFTARSEAAVDISAAVDFITR